ncbi:MAG: trimethylamine methyltransferase family protein [Spirochaetales bacterium]|nr:trimethylamine methyltransferase family protein [Spirochaetales bacterium]
MIRGFRRRFKPLEIATEEEIDAIHKATLEVLWKTGVLVEHERALTYFSKHGCQVDFDARRVRIPPVVVEDCLRKAPSVFGVKARDPEDDIVIGGDTVYFTPFPGMQTVDLDTWQPRPPTRKEYYDYIKLCDALPNVHFLTCYPYFGFRAVPEVMKIPESIAAKIRNSSKINLCCYANDCEIFTIRMVQAMDGMEAFGAGHSAPPLSFSAEMMESFFRYVEAGFPIWAGGGPVMGGTTPVTVAGSMVVTNAEMVAYVVFTQLLRPGTRVMVHDYALPINMKTGAPNFGAIEAFVHQAIFSQIWRRYGVPSVATSAGPVSSKKIDFQSGYEKAFAALIAALSGAHVIQFAGGIYGELAAHPAQAVLDNDIAGMVGRFLQGAEVNDDTLAVDLIEEVGPIPGHYLGKAHTREWWRKEFFLPEAADKLTLPEWLKGGQKDCLDYALARAEELVSSHRPTPLSAAQEQELERILREEREYYRGKGLISEKAWSLYERDLCSPSYPFA